jgi:hypothetical protein
MPSPTAPLRPLRAAACAALLAFASGVALAALDAAPSDLPAAHVQRTPAVTPSGVAYTEISRTLKSGTVVHEYVDASGAVFALSWSGPYKPDLKRLLGRHFERLNDEQARAPRQANRSRLDVDTSDLVVQSGGHMGAFEGRAWLPSRLPAGFDPQEMQ